jgi:hypothetical protein
LACYDWKYARDLHSAALIPSQNWTAARGIEATLREKQNEPTEKKKNPWEKYTFCKNAGLNGDISVCRKKIRAEQENGANEIYKK